MLFYTCTNYRELADEISYSANNLNQYTGIVKNEETPFTPTFDDDGNQLTVQTATGIWTVAYNAENRPVTFTKGTTVVECKYDSQGRRFEKKVTEDGTIVFWQRYAYKGYLQIAAFNVTTETMEWGPNSTPPKAWGLPEIKKDSK